MTAPPEPTAARSAGSQTRPRSRNVSVLAWFVGFAVMVLAVPFVVADVVELHHDLYYLVYGSLVVLYVAVFMARVPCDWRRALRNNLGLSLGVGVLVGAVAVRQVLSDDSTDHPDGAFFVFELFWRGVGYGLIDAVALFVFPALVTYALFRGDRHGVARKFGFAGAVLLLTLVVTTTYHLGYEHFRGEDVANPLTGGVFMSVPAMLTGNPVGALVAHGAVHVSAVAHEYYGADPGYLPPNLTDYPDRAGGLAGVILAVAWLLLLGGLVYQFRARLFGVRALRDAGDDGGGARR